MSKLLLHPAPHFVRFCRALALLSSASVAPVVVLGAAASGVVACSSTTSEGVTVPEDAGDAASDTHTAYDGTVVGVAPCDGGCGVTIDSGNDAIYTGDAIGVSPGDAAVDTNPDVPAGGPGAAPDLPFFA